ncbi:MAG: FCD domain-containing protein [Planctomycetota bacterium]|jgi:GntR family transcriptional repressor for pyruvate dehydrogenase complex
MEAIDRTKLSDVVADRLKSYIIERGLKPGARLPTEAQLATSFGVSRLSLREATKALGFLGMLDAKPGRGLTVGRVNMNRVTECLGFHPGLHDADPLVLIDTRVVIEVGVLQHVARRMASDAAIYERLNDINAKLRQAQTVQRWVDLDIEFHNGLLDASGLTPLTAFADVLSIFFRRFRESVKKSEWSMGIASHQAIIDELRAGNVAAAETRLRTHIESHRHRMGL